MQCTHNIHFQCISAHSNIRPAACKRLCRSLPASFSGCRQELTAGCWNQRQKLSRRSRASFVVKSGHSTVEHVMLFKVRLNQIMQRSKCTACLYTFLLSRIFCEFLLWLFNDNHCQCLFLTDITLTVAQIDTASGVSSDAAEQLLDQLWTLQYQV